MNNKFDELAKNVAQSVTRRGALKQFGVGVAVAVLAAVGFAHKAQAGPHFNCDCSASPFWGCKSDKGGCFKVCVRHCSGG